MQRRGVRVVLRLGPAGQPEFALIRQGGPIPPDPPLHKGLGAGLRDRKRVHHTVHLGRLSAVFNNALRRVMAAGCKKDRMKQYGTLMCSTQDLSKHVTAW